MTEEMKELQQFINDEVQYLSLVNDAYRGIEKQIESGKINVHWIGDLPNE